MTTRIKEKKFVKNTLGKYDPDFFQNNCASCHVTTCLDCHGKKRQNKAYGTNPVNDSRSVSYNGHGTDPDSNLDKPKSDNCLNCHKGYFTGWEFYGRAPREDNLRYQRGKTFKGESYLKMLPDVHALAGMQCSDCHSMESLMNGKTSSKTCTDCHKPDPSVIEHSIKAHLTKLECYACHSAWASQEYGTFFIRFTNSSNKKYFRLNSMNNSSRYIKSGFLKKQDSPPLGINIRGKISPIRPQFIIYFTDIKNNISVHSQFANYKRLHNNKPVEEENILLSARWKAFFPHTIRRGTHMCNDCHNNSAKFLLKNKKDGIFQLEKNKMSLISFQNQKGQSMSNGSFMTLQRFKKMISTSDKFKKLYVIKWKNLTKAIKTAEH